MRTLCIDRLHSTHGERQIRQKKAADFRELSVHDLAMAIAEKPIAIVLGPRGEPHVIIIMSHARWRASA